MAQATVAEFVQAVEQDPILMAKLKAAVDIESYYEISKEHGYDFTPEEFHSESNERFLKELAMRLNPGIKPRRHLNSQ